MLEKLVICTNFSNICFEVEVPKQFVNFLLADFKQGKNRILACCSPDGRKYSKNVTIFFMDGTFKFCPKRFIQMFTIHADRERLHSAIIYDLRLKTFRDIAMYPMTKEFHETPVLCVHENVVYGAEYKDIYRFEDTGGSGRWVNVIKSIVTSNIRISSMVSHGGYIYLTLRYFHDLFRFKPDVHKNIQEFTDLHNSTIAMCNSGNRVLAMTVRKDESEMLTVEGFSENEDGVIAEVLWTQTDPHVKPHKYTGCCALITSLPPLNSEVPDYHKQCLLKYSDKKKSI